MGRRKLFEMSDELKAAQPLLSRQALYQLQRIENGLCANCGKEPLDGKRLGANCAKKQRERMREKCPPPKIRSRRTTKYSEEAAR